MEVLSVGFFYHVFLDVIGEINIVFWEIESLIDSPVKK